MEMIKINDPPSLGVPAITCNYSSFAAQGRSCSRRCTSRSLSRAGCRPLRFATRRTGESSLWTYHRLIELLRQLIPPVSW